MRNRTALRQSGRPEKADHERRVAKALTPSILDRLVAAKNHLELTAAIQDADKATGGASDKTIRRWTRAIAVQLDL